MQFMQFDSAKFQLLGRVALCSVSNPLVTGRFPSLRSVGQSVRPSVGNDRKFWEKTNDWIEMPVGVVSRVGRRNSVLDGGPVSHWTGEWDGAMKYIGRMHHKP